MASKKDDIIPARLRGIFSQSASSTLFNEDGTVKEIKNGNIDTVVEALGETNVTLNKLEIDLSKEVAFSKNTDKKLSEIEINIAEIRPWLKKEFTGAFIPSTKKKELEGQIKLAQAAINDCKNSEKSREKIALDALDMHAKKIDIYQHEVYEILERNGDVD